MLTEVMAGNAAGSEVTTCSRAPIQEHLLSRNVERFRGGLVFKAYRLLYHSTLGSRVMKKKKEARIRLYGKGNSNSHGARPVYQNHLDDKVEGRVVGPCWQKLKPRGP